METQNSSRIPTGVHPNLDVLIEYYHERLEAGAAEPLQEHLVHCRHCTAVLLDLEDFSDSEDAQPASQDLVESQLLARVVTSQIRTEKWRNTALLTASLLVATALPFGIYYQRHSQRPAERVTVLSPEINLPMVSLYPRSALRGSQVNRLELPAGARFFSIALATVDLPSSSDYRLVISDSFGSEIVSLPGLRPSPLGTFSLGLPTSLMPPGKYQLQLFAIDGRTLLIEEYSFEIVPIVQPSYPTAK